MIANKFRYHLHELQALVSNELNLTSFALLVRFAAAADGLASLAIFKVQDVISLLFPPPAFITILIAKKYFYIHQFGARAVGPIETISELTRNAARW